MNKSLLIITGASRGIGKATAKKYQEHGWHVVNISRSKSAFADLNIAVDLTADNWQQVVMQTLEPELKNPRKISLVHNAAMLATDTVEDVDQAVLEKNLQLGVVVPSLLNKLIIPFMQQPSSILYVGSTLSEQACPNAYSYIVTKHAVAGMMRATTQDLFGKPIHAACICPGFTETEMLQDRIGDNNEVWSQIKATVSENRLIAPEEIADLIYYAATHSVLNGSILHANLGQRQS